MISFLWKRRDLEGVGADFWISLVRLVLGSAVILRGREWVG
jgi:hypothetical protein